MGLEGACMIFVFVNGNNKRGGGEDRVVKLEEKVATRESMNVRGKS